MSVLAGARVLVTRAREDQAALADLLRARGAEPVALPCIELGPPSDRAPLDDALAHLERFDLIAVASPHAARRLWAELAGKIPSARIAAVGEATAATLRELGGVDALSPALGAGADALLAAVGASAHGLRVLLPRAEESPPDLADGLRALGAQVVAVALYRTTRAAGPDPHAMSLLRARLVHAITFASGTAARGFVELVGPDAVGLAAGCAVACMGEQCAAVARAAGLRVDAVGNGGLSELVTAAELALSKRI